MSPAQVRAARSWLGWSQQQLAKTANVGLSTVKDFENGSRKPISNNLQAMQRALENAGIEFLFDPQGDAIGMGKAGIRKALGIATP